MLTIKPSIPTTSAISSEANDDGDFLDACARGGPDVSYTAGEEIRQVKGIQPHTEVCGGPF
jgi:hypothetical protein